MAGVSHASAAAFGQAANERRPPGFACVFLGCSGEDYRLASRLVDSANVRLHRADSLKQADLLLAGGDARVLLTETKFPGGTWRDALEMGAGRYRNVAVVVAATLAGEAFWLDVLEQGAYDLILKPFVAEELLRILANADACARARTPAGRVRKAGHGW
jgi:DNA-binding NtrC family response regulator